MAFKVPASETPADAAAESFAFEIGDGSFAVRKYKYHSIDDLSRLEDDGGATLEFFKGDDEAQRAAVGALTLEQFAALMVAWRDDSEVEAGESQASGS